MRRIAVDEEHRMFREAFRAFLATEVIPHRDRFLAQGQVDREVWEKAGEHGFLVPQAPERFGGLALDDFRYDQIMAEELGLCGESGFIIYLHNTIVAPYLLRHASLELQERYLPGAVKGTSILGVAMTEPDFGSNLAGMRTRAVEEGDSYRLSGSKVYISNGSIGDVFVVAARTGQDGRDGISLFIVEADSPGFTRSKLKKMGMHSQDTCELAFDDVAVPRANLLGEEGKGFSYLVGGLAEERLVVAIWNLASAESAMRETCNFVRERKVFGQMVGQFQNTQFTLAGLRAKLDMAQAYLDRLVEDINEDCIEGSDAAAAKLLCSELQGEVVDSCLQFYGGAGYMDEYPISRLYADARITRIFAGTSEIMKTIIARTMDI